MTEQEAKLWLTNQLNVSRETLRLLERFATLVIGGGAAQNLISRSTEERIWARHIADSAQLLPMANLPGDWLDIGSGAGFPGIVIALMQPDRPITLVEPRRLRADFLRSTVTELALSNVTVVEAKGERYSSPAASIISARAVAPLSTLLRQAHHLAEPKTIWLLPKGRTAASELAEARKSWQGDFTLHRSVTDQDASIVVATQVAPRSGR